MGPLCAYQGALTEPSRCPLPHTWAGRYSRRLLGYSLALPVTALQETNSSSRERVPSGRAAGAGWLGSARLQGYRVPPAGLEQAEGAALAQRPDVQHSERRALAQPSAQPRRMRAGQNCMCCFHLHHRAGGTWRRREGATGRGTSESRQEVATARNKPPCTSQGPQPCRHPHLRRQAPEVAES